MVRGVDPHAPGRTGKEPKACAPGSLPGELWNSGPGTGPVRAADFPGFPLVCPRAGLPALLPRSLSQPLPEGE